MPKKAYVFSDFDGTLTSVPGNKLVFTDFYQRIFGSGDYTKEIDGPVDFDSITKKMTAEFGTPDKIPRDPRRLTTEAVAALKEMLKEDEVQLVIVTKNRYEYIRALLLYEGFKPHELDKIMLYDINGKDLNGNSVGITGGSKFQVVLDVAKNAEPGSVAYGYDDYDQDFEAMRRGAIISKAFNKCDFETANPGEFKWGKIWEKISNQIKGVKDTLNQTPFHSTPTPAFQPKTLPRPSRPFEYQFAQTFWPGVNRDSAPEYLNLWAAKREKSQSKACFLIRPGSAAGTVTVELRGDNKLKGGKVLYLRDKDGLFQTVSIPEDGHGNQLYDEKGNIRFITYPNAAKYTYDQLINNYSRQGYTPIEHNEINYTQTFDTEYLKTFIGEIYHRGKENKIQEFSTELSKYVSDDPKAPAALVSFEFAGIMYDDAGNPDRICYWINMRGQNTIPKKLTSVSYEQFQSIMQKYHPNSEIKPKEKEDLNDQYFLPHRLEDPAIKHQQLKKSTPPPLQKEPPITANPSPPKPTQPQPKPHVSAPTVQRQPLHPKPAVTRFVAPKQPQPQAPSKTNIVENSQQLRTLRDAIKNLDFVKNANFNFSFKSTSAGSVDLIIDRPDSTPSSNNRRHGNIDPISAKLANMLADFSTVLDPERRKIIKIDKNTIKIEGATPDEIAKMKACVSKSNLRNCSMFKNVAKESSEKISHSQFHQKTKLVR